MQGWGCVPRSGGTAEAVVLLSSKKLASSDNVVMIFLASVTLDYDTSPIYFVLLLYTKYPWVDPIRPTDFLI